MNSFELVRKDNTDKTLAYACGKCGTVYDDTKRSDQCCAPYKCEDCGTETKRYITRCDSCSAAKRFEREKAAFHKAKKVAVKDYDHDHVWVPQVQQYQSVEDVLDGGTGEGDIAVSYAYAVRPNAFPKPDAVDIAYNMAEEMYEDAMDDLDVDGLQKLIDEWYAKQNSHGFIEDDTCVVIFDESAAMEEMGSWR